MSKIQSRELPDEALSTKYAHSGAFTDCFSIDISRKVSLDEYIEAFYTTSLFKVERTVLSLFARKPSTDEDAKQLSLGNDRRFSAWTVENRLPNQILLCDFTNKTRSWLMVDYQENMLTPVTRLYFGSVVIPKSVSEFGPASFGFLFHTLSGFHYMYSRLLLRSAFVRLEKKGTDEHPWTNFA